MIKEVLVLEPEWVVVEKPSRADRLKRSIAARLRRKETKHVKEVHSYKEEKDARERFQAKKRLEKQKKQKFG